MVFMVCNQRGLSEEDFGRRRMDGQYAESCVTLALLSLVGSAQESCEIITVGDNHPTLVKFACFGDLR